MMLTLQLTGPEEGAGGPARRHAFSTAGGVIGRARTSDWVLPHAKVSGRHALITFLDGAFYIEDTSTNGVFINSPGNRLVAGRRYALRAGDRIFIEPYQIEVSVSTGEASPLDVLAIEDAAAPSRPAPPPRPAPLVPDPRRDLVPEPVPVEELDPLKLLGGAPKRTPARQVPTAEELEHRSVMSDHYQPPAVIPPPAPVAAAPPQPAPAQPFVIPPDYDPLSDDFGQPEPAPAVPVPPAAPWSPPAPAGPVAGYRPAPPAADEAPLVAFPPASAPVTSASIAPAPLPPVTPVPASLPTPAPAAPVTPAPVSFAPTSPVPAVTSEPLPRATPAPVPAAPPPMASAPEGRPAVPAPPAAPAPQESDAALAALLAGAGLEHVQPTPELARAFGEIFRVVVSGVMDVLQSRQQVKDEFRMRMTQFRPADNNPLKFSANVDDALHNLLVKRNPAYLGPVEAFEDAFEDLRNHQLAVLAGMRVAFDSLLAAFDPDELEKQFDRQMKRAPLLHAIARLHYWELYRDRRDEMAKDADATFKSLFGEEFARAYEEQLKRLKAERRAKPAGDETRCLP